MRMTLGLKQIYIIIAICATIALAMVAFSKKLVLRHYRVNTDLVSHPVRIAHISDLHSTYYGDNQSELIEALNSQMPDIIVLTGDILDSKRPYDGAISLISQIASVYPCYYVAGNHEFATSDIANIKSELSGYGITVLSGNCSMFTTPHGDKLCICGIDDPNVVYEDGNWDEQLRSCESSKPDGIFSILLSHHPERVAFYEQCSFDLILAGHAHGGQIRLPWLINGFFAPNQGLFPKYASGLYKLENRSTLIVSRGLMVNELPRIFNPPELVIIDIMPSK